MRDLNGTELREGDMALVPAAFGQLVIGQLVKINAGLGAPGTQEGTPSVIVRLDLFIPAQPNGVVGGLVKLEGPKPTTILQEG